MFDHQCVSFSNLKGSIIWPLIKDMYNNDSLDSRASHKMVGEMSPEPWRVYPGGIVSAHGQVFKNMNKQNTQIQEPPRKIDGIFINERQTEMLVSP